MIFGAIVAGGIGSRMNATGIPKQFLPLGKSKKPIIIHTIEKFLLCETLDYIYLGVHKEWIDYTEELLKKYDIVSDKIFITIGGSDRNLTILNIINEIEKNHGENPENIIITHDAVRPFLTLRMIKENIKATKEVGACDTVIPAIDTIIESHDSGFVNAIPNRRFMYQGQTPQSFNMSKLKRLYSSLSLEEKEVLTDACKIFIFKDEQVALVKGDPLNIKITTQSDYKIANTILGGNMID